MKKLLFILSYLILFYSFAAGNADNGKIKSSACIACHGIDGNSLSSVFPKIAGQGKKYLYKQLQDFKNSTRKDAIMFGIVSSLNKQDMLDLSAYFSQQKTSISAAKNDKKMLSLAKKIYKNGKNNVTACAACHGATGAGLPSAKFPKLSHQHAAYTAKQLRNFRQVSFNKQTNASNLSRNNDYKKMMQNTAKSLTDDEIEALSQYIAGLH